MTTEHALPPIVWRRNARARRISLRIEPRAGEVVVTLPPRASLAAARTLLQTHRDWIADRLARLPAPTPLAPGSAIPLDGLPRQIVSRPEGFGTQTRGTVLVQGLELHVAGDPAFLPRRLLDWLRAHARRQLAAAARAKADAAALPLRRVTVKDTRSRWGSCSAAGTVMFSWRLVMAPPEVQDYVVGHELAHLRHMNHSPAFWALAAELTPHRALADRWLRTHGSALHRIA